MDIRLALKQSQRQLPTPGQRGCQAIFFPPQRSTFVKAVAVPCTNEPETACVAGVRRFSVAALASPSPPHTPLKQKLCQQRVLAKFASLPYPPPPRARSHDASADRARGPSPLKRHPSIASGAILAILALPILLVPFSRFSRLLAPSRASRASHGSFKSWISASAAEESRPLDVSVRTKCCRNKHLIMLSDPGELEGAKSCLSLEEARRHGNWGDWGAHKETLQSSILIVYNGP